MKIRSLAPLPAAILALLILASLIPLSSFLRAHYDGEAPHGGHPPLHAIDTMRAFADDHHAPESLSSLSGTACVGGVAGGYPCDNVDLMAFLPLDQIGGGAGNDIWGWTDPLDGHEYAIMGRSNGTSFIDISDPINPLYLGTLPPHAANSSWRDIKVYANHAFIVTEAVNSGMQVFDLTQLRSVAAPPVTFSETAWYNGFSTAHNIVINEASGYAYAVGTNTGSCGRGLHFINIQDPANPVAAGCFSSDGYTHDAQCVNYNGPDTDHQGKEICFAYNEDTLTIVDVSNKAAPVQLSRTLYSGNEYTHQGWLTEDQTYLLLDDEGDERYDPSVTNTRTYIWDVSNLDAPINTGHDDGPSNSIDHNQYIKGDYSYQANYQSGLRILDISNIASATLSQAGYFDIYPGGDSANYNGAWSNFPYFDSGLVVVSGIEQGLFILRPTLGPLSDPPTVGFLIPAPNDSVDGDVSIQIDASDDVDTAGSLDVEWSVDGIDWAPAPWVGPYYQATWDSTNVANGAITIRARATDSDSRTANTTVDVMVFNPERPFHIDSVQVTTVSAGGPRNIGRATVTVLDDLNAPLQGVAVTGDFSGDWSGSRSGTTGANGQVELETPPVKRGADWSFCVTAASKTGWTYDQASSTICSGGGGGGGAGTVRGVITDSASAQAIAGANVSADTGQNDTTDAGGSYTLNAVPAGSRSVSVTAAGYDPQNKPANVQDAQETFVDFTLVAQSSGGYGTIKGTVSDANGAKLSDVSVTTDSGPSAITNKGGKFTIQNVPAGDRTITASKSGYVTQQQVVALAAGASQTVNFALE